MARNKPSDRQIWVMYKMAKTYGLGLIHTLQDTFDSPFSVCNNSSAKRFFESMVGQGWIDRDSEPNFYRLTDKAKDWIKENPETDKFYKEINREDFLLA